MSPFIWERSLKLRTVIACSLAVLLPLVSADLNLHFRVLQYIPFALYFLSIAIVASIGGLFPALISVVISVGARAHTVSSLHRNFIPKPSDVIAAAILGVAALLVSLLTGSRRKAITALHERTQALIDSLHSGKCASWILDLESGKSARWYSGSYPIFGRPFAEIENLPSLTPLLHPEDQLRMPALAKLMRTTSQTMVFEHRVVWPNGELHWLEARGTRVPGKGCIWRGVTMDVTEHKLAEIALLRSEKLAAMGRLASTVAHEINNPLESVTNLLYLATTDPHLSPETRTYLATAEAELARLGNITRLTLGFIRTSESRSILQIAEVVENVLSIFRPRLEAKHIRVERSFQPGVTITAANHELRQIVTNLVANAIDAIPTQQGVLAIRIGCDQTNASLQIEDNGCGIDADHIARIFDPFFTTKDDVGTGIGLWVTKELVEKNGGHITVQSGNLSNGMKTHFRLEFPLASVSPSA